MEGTQIPFKGHKMNPGIVHSWTGLQTTVSANCPRMKGVASSAQEQEKHRTKPQVGALTFLRSFQQTTPPHTHMCMLQWSQGQVRVFKVSIFWHYFLRVWSQLLSYVWLFETPWTPPGSSILAFLHVLFNFRTCKKAKDRGALIEEKTNHCLLRINLNSYPIISEQS